MTENSSPSGLSRRTVVKAAAWSLPVMAIGSNAPAFAASPIITATGLGCKFPGNSGPLFKGYSFLFTIDNPFGQTVTISLLALAINNQALTIYGSEESAQCGTITQGNTVVAPPGMTKLMVYTSDAPNSQVGALQLQYRYTNPNNNNVVTEIAAAAFTGNVSQSNCPFTTDKTLWPCPYPPTIP